MPVWCVARPTAAPCGHFAALPLVRSTFGLRGYPPLRFGAFPHSALAVKQAHDALNQLPCGLRPRNDRGGLAAVVVDGGAMGVPRSVVAFATKRPPVVAVGRHWWCVEGLFSCAEEGRERCGRFVPFSFGASLRLPYFRFAPIARHSTDSPRMTEATRASPPIQ